MPSGEDGLGTGSIGEQRAIPRWDHKIIVAAPKATRQSRRVAALRMVPNGGRQLGRYDRREPSKYANANMESAQKKIEILLGRVHEKIGISSFSRVFDWESFVHEDDLDGTLPTPLVEIQKKVNAMSHGAGIRIHVDELEPRGISEFDAGLILEKIKEDGWVIEYCPPPTKMLVDLDMEARAFRALPALDFEVRYREYFEAKNRTDFPPFEAQVALLKKMVEDDAKENRIVEKVHKKMQDQSVLGTVRSQSDDDVLFKIEKIGPKVYLKHGQDSLLIGTPRFNESNELVLDCALKNPGRRLTRGEIENLLNGTKISKSFSKVFDELGFRGPMRVFVDCSKDSVTFHPEITEDDLIAQNYSEDSILQAARGRRGGGTRNPK